MFQNSSLSMSIHCLRAVMLSCTLGLTTLTGLHLAQAATDESLKEAASQVPKKDRVTAEAFVHALKQDHRDDVASMIQYPLERERPLKPIKNKKDLLAHYDEFFDAEVIQKLSEGLGKIWTRSDDTSIGDSGLVWIRDGKVITLNCSTAQNAKIEKAAKQKDQRQINSSVAKYDALLFECLTSKFHVRIQKKDNVIYYVSWARKQSTMDKPDLILKGSADVQGTSGGVIYNFKSGQINYSLENLTLCESDCPPKLLVTKGDKTLVDQVCEK